MRGNNTNTILMTVILTELGCMALLVCGGAAAIWLGGPNVINVITQTGGGTTAPASTGQSEAPSQATATPANQLAASAQATPTLAPPSGDTAAVTAGNTFEQATI